LDPKFGSKSFLIEQNQSIFRDNKNGKCELNLDIA